MTGKILYGLVLCGGNSSRMGRDKSKITYHLKEQKYHVFDLLKELSDKVFISCNHDQSREEKDNYSFIEDDSSIKIIQNTNQLG